MMKRLALTIALTGLSGGAFAADLRGPIIEAPPPLPVPVAGFSWTGGYAGVNVGVGTADANYRSQYTSTSTPGGPYELPPCNGGQFDGDTGNCAYYAPPTPNVANSESEDHRSGGVLGGVQVGYNYAVATNGLGGFGGLGGLSAVPVIGVEADFDGSGVASSGTLGGFASGDLTGSSLYVGAKTDINYVGTVRGRLGVAFDRLLVFGTGGFAYGETESSVYAPGPGIYSHASNFHTGIAYGGGLEFALTNNLLLRAEYLHYDFNKKSIAQGSSQGMSACGCEYTSTYAIYEKPSLDVVRAGLSYKFDFARAVAAPVIARY